MGEDLICREEEYEKLGDGEGGERNNAALEVKGNSRKFSSSFPAVNSSQSDFGHDFGPSQRRGVNSGGGRVRNKPGWWEKEKEN